MFIMAILFVITINQQSIAQGCNPILGGMSYDLACINAGSSILTVDWEMGGGNPACVAPSGSWIIQISLPATGEYTVASIAAVNGPEFTWTLDPSGTTLNGISNQSINWFTGGTILITVDGIQNSIPACALVPSNGNIQILPSIVGGTPANFSNMISDDNQSAALGVDLSIALPVELLSFTGRKIDKVIQLDWTTVTEQNNDGFEIHKSLDGRDWDVIGWVDGNGTVTRNIDYSFIDKFPSLGENYYRLKQIDYDGQYEFSDIIVIDNVGEKPAINVLPNPSSGPFSVVVENPRKEQMVVTIFDTTGKVIFDSGIIEDMNMWRKDFDLLRKEMYFISVQIGKEVLTDKIILLDRA